MIAIRLMPDRQCTSCTRQAEWGCFARKVRDTGPNEDPQDGWENPAFMPLTLMGEDTYACPRQPLREDPIFWVKVLKLYAFYRKGYLPQPGAVIDQANQLLETFSILDQVNAECDNQQQASPQKGDPTANRGR